MSKRFYIFIITVGLIFIFFSLAALAYAAWPVTGLQEHAPLAPTLFLPPG